MIHKKRLEAVLKEYWQPDDVREGIEWALKYISELETKADKDSLYTAYVQEQMETKPTIAQDLIDGFSEFADSLEKSDDLGTEFMNRMINGIERDIKTYRVLTR